MPSQRFDDHFSKHAADYARYRPHYPERLFSFLAEVSPHRDVAWDAATGNGQAARGLAEHFARVVATDASGGQLAQGQGDPGVRFVACRAETRCLAPRSAALVTIAQALHWVDTEPFYETVRRVAVPGGVVAAWCYTLPRSTPAIDGAIDRLHGEVLGEYWPPGRRHVDAAYATLPFPFRPIEAPRFSMRTRWDLSRFVDYVETWSAARRYEAARGRAPVDLVREELAQAWGDPLEKRQIAWPLALTVGRVDQ